MVPIRGEPVIRTVVEALRGARLVRDITVVVRDGSPVGAMVEDMAHVCTAQGPSILDTLQAAMNAYSDEERVLLVTCDLPLLTAVAVDDFVAQSLASGAEMSYAIVDKATLEARIPGSRRTYVRLRDGHFSGGNLFCVSPAFVRREQRMIRTAYAARKNPIALGKMLGLGFMLSAVAGLKSVDAIVSHAERILNCKLNVVRSTHPEVAFDIDKPCQVEIAKQVLARLAEERKPRS